MEDHRCRSRDSSSVVSVDLMHVDIDPRPLFLSMMGEGESPTTSLVE